MNRLLRGTLFACVMSVSTHIVGAQALGPQRQFLAIEPYYEFTRLDYGSAVTSRSNDNISGVGARLWINLDPFHFIRGGSIALYGSFSPSQSSKFVSIGTWGAEYDQYFVRRPIGGFIDPFLSLGVGGIATTNDNAQIYGALGKTPIFLTLTPGGGIRIPVPNRFELRFDAKDLIMFDTPTGVSRARRASNNLQLQAGLGITF